jgi:hypothetical protein
MTMLADRLESSTLTSEKALRKQIDRTISRALVDSDYATQLLSDPTVALGDHGCSPHQFKLLRSVHALDLVDFAQQVHALFWQPEPTPSPLEATVHLAAAASI